MQLLEPGRYIWLLKALYGLLMLLPQVCLVNLQLLLSFFLLSFGQIAKTTLELKYGDGNNCTLELSNIKIKLSNF